jgi:hypothetical protein
MPAWIVMDRFVTVLVVGPDETPGATLPPPDPPPPSASAAARAATPAAPNTIATINLNNVFIFALLWLMLKPTRKKCIL